MIQALLDRVQARGPALPAELRRLYDGDLALPEGVVANFVATLDGVVSFALPGQEGGGVISGRDPGDRFLMDLLRASCDAIVVGARTLEAVPPTAKWIPGEIYPPARELYAQYRRDVLGKPAPPLLAVVSASGRAALPAAARAVVLGQGRVPPAAIVAQLQQEFGARHILLEGGPHLFGEFVAARLVDELFLTLSPQIAGRAASSLRPALVEGAAFTPGNAAWLELASVKSSASHLYLRYRARS
ncbi:MAG: RibD family protein [Terriglobales bacterium]